MKRTRRALLASLLVALTVAVSRALAGVPNVELVTLVVFLAGYLLGIRLGVGIGAVVAVGHSLFNPLGPAPPPLLAAQIIGFGLVGAAGGIVGPALAGMRHRVLVAAAAGLTGGVLTLIYQTLTGVASFYTFSGEKSIAALLGYVGAGIAFSAMHIVWNTAVFAVVTQPTLRVLRRHREELE